MTETLLPPKARTELWQQVTEGAAKGEFRLQYCLDCGDVQYPPREVCKCCLSDNLEWRVMNGSGKVLSHTIQHASSEEWFQKKLPVKVVLVQLDIGAIVYAFASHEVSATGTRVRIEAIKDESGEGVLWALSK